MLSFFPLDVLDEIWDLRESVSEDFLPTLTSSNLRLGILDQVKGFVSQGSKQEITEVTKVAPLCTMAGKHKSVSIS